MGTKTIKSGKVMKTKRSFPTNILVISFIIIVLMTATGFATTGKVIGSVVDKETGEPLIGASVLIKGTTIGAASDLDGKYMVKLVPPGTYTLLISSVGYSPMEIVEVVIEDGKSLNLDIALERRLIEGKTIKVTAKAVQNTEASLLKARQHSTTISDAISSESISRSGSGDAAEAMSKVTGASVVGGKFVYVRGLGGRYSNARLNGAVLPTADPDGQAVQMDLFPTNLLDNITVEKNFSPDKPGSFSGGSVDLRTKDIPENLTLSFSASTGYNSIATWNENFLSTPRGGDDWIAMDKDFYGIPDGLKDGIPILTSATRNPDSALKLENASRSLSSSMSPRPIKAPLNQSYSFSYGNNYNLGGRPLGLIASLSYNRKYSFYEDGKVARWTLVGPSAPILSNDYILDDVKGVEEVLWGGMIGFNYPVHLNHKISLQGVYNRQGELTNRYLHGPVFKDFGNDTANTRYETRSINYTEQWISNIQLNGEHLFSPLRVTWQGSLSENDSHEPDSRYFSNHYVMTEYMGRDTTVYLISQNLYPAPVHLFRELSEKNGEGQLNLSLPVGKRYGRDVKISSGLSFLKKSRDVKEDKYMVQWQTWNAYNGDPDDFLKFENMGIDWDHPGTKTIIIGEDTVYRYVYNNYLKDATSPRNTYSGEEKIFGTYLMSEFQALAKLRVIGGVRYEQTKMAITESEYISSASTDGDGVIDEIDWLPSIGLTYQPADNVNFRAAYGKTLARPTIRELSPLVTEEFVKGFLLVGNPDLKHTRIDNYDVRWEWFVRPGEIVAASGFYKKFRDPIEKTILNDNMNIQYKNVEKAVVYGLEFEFRKNLDFIGSGFNNFSLDGNFTLAVSDINLSEYELNNRLFYDSSASSTRPLQGQSPYLVNGGLSYDNGSSGTSISLLYNVFGRRLSEVGSAGKPDVYEQPRHMFDFTISQKFFEALSFKCSCKNLFNARVRKTMEYYGTEYIVQEYSLGTSWSVGLSYRI